MLSDYHRRKIEMNNMISKIRELELMQKILPRHYDEAPTCDWMRDELEMETWNKEGRSCLSLSTTQKGT